MRMYMLHFTSTATLMSANAVQADRVYPQKVVSPPNWQMRNKVPGSGTLKGRSDGAVRTYSWSSDRNQFEAIQA